MKGHDLLSLEKPWRAFLKLALPAVLGTLVTLAYNLTDTYYIGLLRDTAQLSAVSVAMPYMWAVSAIAGLFSAGAPAVISLLLGAGDAEGAGKCRSFAVFGTLAFAVLLTPLTLALVAPVTTLMGISGETFGYSTDYLKIIMLFNVFSAVQGAMQGVLRADGRATAASIGSVLGVALNIALDPLFIFAFDMGVTGAALATGIGNAMSFFVFLVLLRRNLSIKSVFPGLKTVRQIVSLSLASVFSSLITAVTVASSLGIASGFGDGFIAAISICTKVITVVVTIVSALAFSMQPFVGFNYAAGEAGRTRAGIAVSCGIGSAICVLASLAFLIFGGRIVAVFTSDADVLAAGRDFMKIYALSTPLTSIQMTALMYLGATGQAKKSLLAGLGKQLLFFVPILAVMRALFGVLGMMWAYPISDMLSTALAVALCFSGKRKRVSPVISGAEPAPAAQFPPDTRETPPDTISQAV